MASNLKLFDQAGSRLYITPEEREQFIVVTKTLDGPERTFCETIARTGCRISEALSLTCDRIDFETKAIIFRSLKKRGKMHFRAVPTPDHFLDTLNLVHGLARAQERSRKSDPEHLWKWGRTKAWQLIKDTMQTADIVGSYATPKGLRHGFAIAALEQDVPLNLIQKWLGHVSLDTTAIYLQAMGKQERDFAKRMWSDGSNST